MENKELRQEEPEKVPIQVKINNARFLVPLVIEFDIVNSITNETIQKDLRANGDIDLANKELFVDDSYPPYVVDLLQKNIFQYLQSMNQDERYYEANNDVYEQAERAQEEHGVLQNELGENYE